MGTCGLRHRGVRDRSPVHDSPGSKGPRAERSPPCGVPGWLPPLPVLPRRFLQNRLAASGRTVAGCLPLDAWHPVRLAAHVLIAASSVCRIPVSTSLPD
jgi:hypothetical protein